MEWLQNDTYSASMVSGKSEGKDKLEAHLNQAVKMTSTLHQKDKTLEILGHLRISTLGTTMAQDKVQSVLL